MKDLDKKIEIPITEVFPNEEYDFTKHFENPDNLDELADSLNIPLEFVERESKVGKFEADIFAKSNEENVIIENQYGVSNFDHLGKLITYGSGKDAKIVVWIVERARDEHIKAINWLNDVSSIDFYLVEVKTFVVKNPRTKVKTNPFVEYQVVVKPNEFSKETEKQKTPSQLIYWLPLWNRIKDILKDKQQFNKEFRCMSPNKGWMKIKTDEWDEIDFGFSVCKSNMKACVSVKKEFYDEKLPKLFDKIEQESLLSKDFVDESFSETYNCVKRQYGLKLDFDNPKTWDAVIEKQIENALKIKHLIEEALNKQTN